MSSLSFDTTQPSQVKGLQGYTVDPIFTVGDKIGDYVPPGILDGIGAFSLNDTTVRILVNHELGSTVGYKYSLANGTQLPGARVSFFDVDKRTFQITDSGLAFDKIINRKGEVVDAASDLDFGGLARLCSAALFEANGFGNGKGFADRIFFTGEENDGGSEFALDTATNTLYALPWLGRAAWENVTELDTGSTDKVAILIGDDRDPAPLILYVGTKNPAGGFLERNGLSNGELFVWVADDPTDGGDAIELDPRNFAGSNNSTKGRFVKIDYYRPDLANSAVDGADSGTSIQDELGYDAQGFATQAQQDKLAADVQAFLFSRPEDVATNPFDGTQAVLASTGRESIFGGADTWGTTYKIDVDFAGLASGVINADATILYDGNEADKKDFGLRSPDNLDWADDGKIYIQEDRAISSVLSSTPLFGATSGQETSIFRLDPSAANPSATLTRIGQVDRSAIPTGQVDSNPADLGNWETSGILDVSNLFGAKPGELFIFDVQAGTLNNGTIITATNIDGNGNGTKTADENLVRGGQLSFLIAPTATLVQSETLVGGATTGDDIVEAGVTTGFDGVNDIVFAGAGSDLVDSQIGGALASGNRIDTGSGADTIFIANNDRAFGGSDADEFFAQGVSGFRVSGGAGDDTFFVADSSNGRVLGGDGDDKIFISGNSGSNLLSGGAGADQFWIFGGDFPASANTITDFQVGTDLIGFQGAGAGVGFAQLTRTGNSIAFGGTTIATLTGVDTTTLTASSFTFA